MMRLYVTVLYYKNLFLERLTSKFRNQNGATVAEYALVLALVVVALITTLSGLGDALGTKIRELTDRIRNAQLNP